MVCRLTISRLSDIIEIACDGKVDDDEQIELEKIVQSLDSARIAIARLSLFVKKNG